ncbi:hypothetical protein [Synechococcus sp. UW140]|uniref:hypothetical protein n=1 Tax=Synechococcus sp. UW140 TaxID=368503 RepID=UPI0025D70762|nr:hypothetical protein [Synechococcus sp. UW140]
MSTSPSIALNGWEGERLKPDSVGKNRGTTWRNGNTKLANKDIGGKNTIKTLSSILFLAFNATSHIFYAEA